MRKYLAILLLLLPGPLLAQARTCEDFGFSHGCKVEGTDDGTYMCDETYIRAEYENDKILDWMGGTLNGVFVKGGPGYNEYYYNPPVVEDFGLTAPDNKDISHTLFCYEDYGPPGEPVPVMQWPIFLALTVALLWITINRRRR